MKRYINASWIKRLLDNVPVKYLAAAAKVNERTVRRWKRGERNPTPAHQHLIDSRLADCDPYDMTIFCPNCGNTDDLCQCDKEAAK